MKNNLKNFSKIFSLLALSLVSFWPMITFGATLSWQIINQSVADKNINLAIILDTDSDKINTVAGEIIISPDWKLVNVSDANSLVNFWIERPVLSEAEGISFAGIIPGGYRGRGLLLTLKLSPQLSNDKNLNQSFSIKNFTALLNDGSGQAAKIKIEGLVKAEPGDNWQILPLAGKIFAPEPFSPVIVNDSNLPTNRVYLVFGTQDKNSGLAYYAIYESWWPVGNMATQNQKLAWVKTDSPYQLKNQTWWNFIYVKAVNQNGGVRIAALSPQFSRSWLYEHWLLSLIIILGLCLGLIIVRQV